MCLDLFLLFRFTYGLQILCTTFCVTFYVPLITTCHVFIIFHFKH